MTDGALGGFWQCNPLHSISPPPASAPTPITDAGRSETIEKKGRLDIVFANAGLGEFAPLGSIAEAFFDRLFNINVKGALFTVK